MYTLNVVVVLYNKLASESIALCTLVDALDSIKSAGFYPKIYVWNNSPGFSQKLNDPSVEWIEGENNNLSYVYNNIAQRALISDRSFLMISDDDTDYSTYDFSSNLLRLKSVLACSATLPEVGCFIPRIHSGGRLVSPGRRCLFKGKLLRRCDSGYISSVNLLGINSGILITRSCYEKMYPLYDERLRFYGTDTDFFIRYQAAFDYAYVLNADLNHSLSEDAQEDTEHALFRWADNLYALNTIFENRSLIFKSSMRFYYFLVKAKLSLKFRDYRFMML